MKSIRRVWTIILTIMLVSVISCVGSYESIEILDVPLQDEVPVDPVTNFEGIVASATELVHRELPRAWLTHFMYEGTRASLLTLNGIMHFTYTERHFGLPRDQLLVGFVEVNVAEGTMALKTEDHTFYYPRTEAISLTHGVELSKLVLVADQQIERIGIGDCYVRLLFSGADWWVVCYPPDSNGFGEVLCDFRVDALTGEVILDGR